MQKKRKNVIPWPQWSRTPGISRYRKETLITTLHNFSSFLPKLQKTILMWTSVTCGDIRRCLGRRQLLIVEVSSPASEWFCRNLFHCTVPLVVLLNEWSPDDWVHPALATPQQGQGPQYISLRGETLRWPVTVTLVPCHEWSSRFHSGSLALLLCPWGKADFEDEWNIRWRTLIFKS